MKRSAWSLAMAVVVAGCTLPRPGVDSDIRGELDKANEPRVRAAPGSVEQALLPPLKMEMPAVRGQAAEQRFDLSVSNAPAAQVFVSIASGTRLSMLVHPNVSGLITINLKDVTVSEALNAIRELYGYEYKVEGSRIFIQPVTIQTKVFNVNYLIGQRQGRSDIRVTSGSIADVPGGAAGAPGTGVPVAGGFPGAGGVPGAAGAGAGGVTDSSRIQTQTRNDFWDELEKTLKAIVGIESGRSVVVNSQAGVVVVRAMPAELRGVENYLKAIRMSVERQVVLEAKIIEVTLNSQYQTGINWAAFSGNSLSVGPVSSAGTILSKGGSGQALATGATSITGPVGSETITSPAVGALPGANLINFNLPGASLFGLAFQTRNFAALLTFLESQGAVQVLSSPRIATINNQKAVLKVGTDQFFLTNISGSTTTTTTTTTGVATPSFPTITLRPFFSGVALDITPQINEDSEIILHIHPSVSDVQTDNRQIDLGGAFGGVVSLPVAKSNVSETDSVVRVIDGNIVAIGGLMKVDVENTRSGLPGTQDTFLEGVFNSTTRTIVKKELVILIKPTVMQSGEETAADLREARGRIINMIPPEKR
jgi:MSHA biogenesis protein MshL